MSERRRIYVNVLDGNLSSEVQPNRAQTDDYVARIRVAVAEEFPGWELEVDLRRGCSGDPRPTEAWDGADRAEAVEAAVHRIEEETWIAWCGTLVTIEDLARLLDEELGGDYYGSPSWATPYISDDGEEYVLLTGTGDAADDGERPGAWAYPRAEVEAWLEEARGDAEPYQHLCDHADVEVDRDLAAELRDAGYALNEPGVCRPALGESR